MTSENEGFLERWSRRKQQPEEEPKQAPQEEPAALPEEQAEPDEPVLTDEDMPDIETLAPDSDVSPFFSSGVSERLRQKALRKIFHSARYNVKDGLDDYDEDFTLLQPLGDADTWEWRRQRERLLEREKERERKRLEEEKASELDAQEAPLEAPDDPDDRDDDDQLEEQPEEK